MREERKQAFLASNVFRRRTVIKPGGYDCIRQSGLFANSGGTAEIFQVFVLLISGQRLFYLITEEKKMKRWQINNSNHF